ncbi:hypothetical protein AHAS_AhasUnG0043900 [Arachis hypogaea]
MELAYISNLKILACLNFSPTDFPQCAEMNFDQFPLSRNKGLYQLNFSAVQCNPQSAILKGMSSSIYFIQKPLWKYNEEEN